MTRTSSNHWLHQSMRKYGRLIVASTLPKVLKIIPKLPPPPFWLKTDQMSSRRLWSMKNWRKNLWLFIILTESLTISKQATSFVVQLASARLARKSSLEIWWNWETTPSRSAGTSTAEAQTPASWLPSKLASNKVCMDFYMFWVMVSEIMQLDESISTILAQRVYIDDLARRY